MTNFVLFIFIFCNLFVNSSIICCARPLNIVSEILQSHEEAKHRLNSILPDTLIQQHHKNKYRLLQKLDQQITALIHYKNSTPNDTKFKDLLQEHTFTDSVAHAFCETFYIIANDTTDLNSEYWQDENFDGNDINIINSYQAFKNCTQKILSYLENNK